jgi:aspartate kinase
MFEHKRARTCDETAGNETRVVVWKFGGSSVADHARLRAVAERMVRARGDGYRVVAVLSAMGKTTDELSALGYRMSDRPPLRELDALLSVGESISCALAAMAIHELGARAVSLNGVQAGVLTDDQHTNARLREITPHRIVAALAANAIVLVTGFQGVSPAGDVTTLGRGGSDASAVALAAALGLTECEIFTDVPGVFTADPRLVPEARQLDALRHEEMLELAEGGAGVLQSRAIELAAAHGIDIHLRSSFTGEPGTWIRNESATIESVEVAGVSHREHDWLYAAPDVSRAALAAALAARGASVGMMVADDGELRFTAPSADPAAVAAAVSATGAQVRVREDLGSVSLVSIGIARKPEIAARALATLQDAGIEPLFVISTPGRVSLHLSAPRVADAVRLLHDEFIEHAGAPSVTDLSAPTRVKGRRPGDAA